MKCINCGAELENQKCPYCGCVADKPEQNAPVNITFNRTRETPPPAQKKSYRTRKTSSKNKGVAIFLTCLSFIGLGGLNRFYVGKTVSGIIYLLTFGLCWIGTIVDLIMIKNGTFTYSDGKPLLK